MASARGAEDGGFVMRIHYSSVTPELPSIFTGALIAITTLALSFIATSLAIESRSPARKASATTMEYHRAR